MNREPQSSPPVAGRLKRKKLHEVSFILPCLLTGRFVQLWVLRAFIVQCIILKQSLKNKKPLQK